MRKPAENRAKAPNNLEGVRRKLRCQKYDIKQAATAIAHIINTIGTEPGRFVQAR